MESQLHNGSKGQEFNVSVTPESLYNVTHASMESVITVKRPHCILSHRRENCHHWKSFSSALRRDTHNLRKKTGIDAIDNLSDEEFAVAVNKAKRRNESLTVEQRAEQMNAIHEIHRQKLIEHHGMISLEDALREFCNEDFPRIQEATAKGSEEEALATGDPGYLQIAQHLRQTRWGIDMPAFDVRLIREGDGRHVEVSLINETQTENGEKSEHA